MTETVGLSVSHPRRVVLPDDRGDLNRGDDVDGRVHELDGLTGADTRLKDTPYVIC